MANPEHVRIAKRGEEAIRNWRSWNKTKVFDLSEADLTCLEITNITIEEVDFSRAVLRGTYFDNVEFRIADFSNANMIASEIYNSVFEYVDLKRIELLDSHLHLNSFHDVDLSYTNLSNCTIMQNHFYKTTFDNTDFSNARCAFSTFADSDLRNAIGLSLMKDGPPSSIGIDTILRSQGNIPIEFLRGCGLPDDVIEYVQSLAKKPIQYYTCFLSHSAKDEAFAKHLYDKLQGSNVRCWYFPESAKTGEKLWGEINKAIHMYDKLVIICTHHSLESEPVLREIEEGLKREQAEKIRKLKDKERVEKGEITLEDFERQHYHTRVLFPITIDDYIFNAWKHPLKHELCDTRVVGEFQKWEDFKSFDKAFNKLLSDLNAGE